MHLDFTVVAPCVINVFKHNQQDATLHNALHVSGAHHQELKTLYTASGICRALSASYRYRELGGTHSR